MAELREASGTRACLLQQEHLIGRGPQCALRLTSNYVSAQHALLRWQGDHWQVIDRGSRNGTHLNDSKLSSGHAYPIEQGALLYFGNQQEAWTLACATPPLVMVVALDDDQAIVDSVGVIGIPSSSDAETTIYLDVDGGWKLEGPDADTSPIVDGQIFETRGRLYRFCCPVLSGSTIAFSSDPVESALHFSVSSDREFIELRLQHARGQVELGCRSHNYLLLLLAEAYLGDLAAGVAPGSCGWLYKEQLATSLKVTDQQIDGEVYRIRKHFAQLGLPQAASIIERRARTRQLRIGMARLHVAPA